TDAFASACGVCALDHPFAIGRFRPLGATRLASTPSRSARAWLGIAVGRSGRFPRIWAVRSRSFPVGRAIYQGSALPLSYGSKPPEFVSFLRWPHPLPGSALPLSYGSFFGP